MTPAGAFQIKTEPINAIRGGYRRPFQRNGRGFDRATNRGGGGADRKGFNCDQSGFTPEHIKTLSDMFRSKTALVAIKTFSVRSSAATIGSPAKPLTASLERSAITTTNGVYWLRVFFLNAPAGPTTECRV